MGAMWRDRTGGVRWAGSVLEWERGLVAGGKGKGVIRRGFV